MAPGGRKVRKSSVSAPNKPDFRAKRGKPASGSALVKKTTITLSIDSPVLKELRKEAEFQKSSLNSKINSALDKYVSFFRYTESMGAAIIPQTQFKEMLEIMDEAKLTLIMKTSGHANVTALVNLLGLPRDLSSLCKYCFDRFIKWSGAYDSFASYIDNEGYPCLVFEHKFGIKWSRIMAETLSETIHDILNFPTETRSLPSSVVVRVMERGQSLE
jgi:hypothetical protein